VFIDGNAEVEGDMLRLIRENNTRWFLTYLMLVCAILLKDLLDLYVLQHQISKSDKKNLLGCIITLED